MNLLLPSDEELFAAVKINDKKAFDLLYQRYWALIYKKAFSYLHDSEASMGIVNDIFLNIWEKRSALNIIIFERYVTAAARYRVYNHVKSAHISRLTYIDDYEKFKNLTI